MSFFENSALTCGRPTGERPLGASELMARVLRKEPEVGPAWWNRSVSILWIVQSSVGLHKGTPPQRTASG